LFAPRGGGDFPGFPNQFNGLAVAAGIAGVKRRHRAKENRG